MKTDTSERFEECLRDFKRKIDTSSVKQSDATAMYALAENLLLRYEEIRKSRESWKQKYYEASTNKKKDPRTFTKCDTEEGTSDYRWGKKVWPCTRSRLQRRSKNEISTFDREVLK